MLLRKVANSADLFWDSLDSQERMIFAYLGLIVAMYLAGMVRRASRENLKAELREELAADGPRA